MTATAAGPARMPALTEIAPAALGLAHLIDAAGGPDAAAVHLPGYDGQLLADVLRGVYPQEVPSLVLRLRPKLGEQAGWTASTEPQQPATVHPIRQRDPFAAFGPDPVGDMLAAAGL